MAAQAWPPPKAFLLPRVPTPRICPPWNRHPQPPNPTSGPLHGLQWLKKVARRLKHLLPIPMKACLAEEMPRKVQKIKPSLWGRLALPGPAQKLGTTGPGSGMEVCSRLLGHGCGGVRLGTVSSVF